MAKKSSIEKNNRREKMSNSHFKKRQKLKAIICDLNIPFEERFQAVKQLSEMPRNGSKVRVHTRCALSGRPHAVYRKFKLSRIALRDLALKGMIPGMKKASW